MKIAVFDSGIGGMTVLKQLIIDFPNNEYFYLGDTANVPYGSKSVETIRKLCETNAERLKNYSPDLVIIACNTASSLALDVFKNSFSTTPVIGVVEPGVDSVLKQFLELPFDINRRILILGTKATIQSRIYSTEIRKRLQFTEVIEQACPLIVPIIEEGWIQHTILKDVIYEYVKPYIQDSSPGVALLACTHYPWAQSVFETVLKNWKVINSSQSVSQFLRTRNLEQNSSTLKVHWDFTDPKSVTEMAINDFKQSLGVIINL